MIAHLKGLVSAISPEGAVLNIAGFGLLVHCGPNTLARLRMGEPAQLFTSLVVREDSLTLYGFATEDERLLFELLQTASGIGPRIAQAALAVYAPDDIRRAITERNISVLTKIPGIGKKGAERLVLELKDRLGPVTASTNQTAVSSELDQVIAGLVALGWSTQQAESAAQTVHEEFRSSQSTTPSVSTVLKRAIALLGKA